MTWLCKVRGVVVRLRDLRLLAEAFSSSELDTSGSGWSPETQLGGAFHAAMPSCAPEGGETSCGGNTAGVIACGDILRSVTPSRARAPGGDEINGSLNTGPPKLGGEEDDEDGVSARPSARRALVLTSPQLALETGGPLD